MLGDFPPPLRRAEALRLLVGVPLPDRESSVRSWRDGSLYMATTHTHTHTHETRTINSVINETVEVVIDFQFRMGAFCDDVKCEACM